MKLIDKEKVVEEIEKLKDEAKIHPSDFGCGRLSICKELMNFLDTLEVKEVDLEEGDAFIEKATSYIQQHWIWNTNMIEDFKNYMKGE